MSFELGDTRRELAMLAPRGVAHDPEGLGLSFKSIGKTIGKIAKPVVKTVGKAAGVASAVGIPGAGFVNAAVNSRVGKKVTATTKKVEAVKKAVAPPKPPPKPPPKMKAAPPPKPKSSPTSPSAGIAKKGSGAVASKPKPAPPTKFNEQSKKAGIIYKKRATAGGGEEIVGTDRAGAVVTKPIPRRVLVANQTPVVDEVLPTNAVQSTVAPVPAPPESGVLDFMAKLTERFTAPAAPAQAEWATSSGGGGGGGGGGMTVPGTGPTGPAPATEGGESSSPLSSPLVLGAAALAAVVLLRK